MTGFSETKSAPALKHSLSRPQVKSVPEFENEVFSWFSVLIIDFVYLEVKIYNFCTMIF